jgi:hypothetical protein
MSPEQCRQESLDERTDLYSLGATYYTLLTGQPPYDLDGNALAVAHCMEPVPDPRKVVAEVPEACAAIIRRAMAKEPVDRYPNAAAMLAELDVALEATAELASPPPAPSASSALADQPTRPIRGMALPPRRRRRWVWLVPALVLLLLGGIVAVILRWPHDPPGVSVSPRWPATPLPVGGEITGIALSHDSSDVLLAWAVKEAKTGHVSLWDAREGRLRHEIPIEGPTSSVALSPAGTLLATGDHQNTRLALFDTHTGLKVASIDMNGGLSGVGFGGDERTLLAAINVFGTPRRLELRNYEVGDRLQQRQILAFPSLSLLPSISGASISRDGKRAAVALDDGQVFLIDVAKWESKQIRPAGASDVHTPVFSPNGALLAAGVWSNERDARALVHVWDTQTGKEVKRLDDHEGAVTAVAFSPNGRSLAAAGSRFLDFWEVGTWRRLGDMHRDNQLPLTWNLTYSPDGKSLFLGGSKELQRYDLTPEQQR